MDWYGISFSQIQSLVLLSLPWLISSKIVPFFTAHLNQGYFDYLGQTCPLALDLQVILLHSIPRVDITHDIILFSLLSCYFSS